jgi:hypothetical protein
LQRLEQFQQTNSHFKVYLPYQNEGSSLRNKRDINVRISSTFFRSFIYSRKKVVNRQHDREFQALSECIVAFF